MGTIQAPWLVVSLVAKLLDGELIRYGNNRLSHEEGSYLWVLSDHIISETSVADDVNIKFGMYCIKTEPKNVAKSKISTLV